MLLSFWASPFLLARGDSSRNKVITDLLLDWTIVPPFLYVLYVGGKYTPNVALNQCLSKLTCTRMLASLLQSEDPRYVDPLSAHDILSVCSWSE
jgi:hypothetical protein